MVLKSQINTNSEEFKEYYNHNIAVVEEYKKFLEEVRIKRDEIAVKLQRERGKLLARERVE